MNTTKILACNVTAQIDFVGLHNDIYLSIISAPGDTYKIIYNDEIVNSGVVDENYELHMNSRAVLKVNDSKIRLVMNKLKKIQIMMNNNYSVDYRNYITK